jgi:hypothetical protein
MSEETIYIIKNNPIINRFLREESYHYKYLYRDDNYIKIVERKAKEKYKLTITDKLENLKDNLKLIKLFMNID